MGAIATLLFSKAGLIGMAIAAVLLVVGIQTARLAHAKSDLTSLRAADKAAADHAKLVAASAAKISDTAAVETKAAQVRIVNRTQTLIKWIPAHVAPTDAHFYPWPRWSLSAYDASLGLSDTPAGTDDSPSEVGANDAAKVFVANNGACVSDQDRLRRLQGWITDQVANARQ